MNLKILFMLMMYYVIISLVLLMGGSLFSGYTNPVNLNDSHLSSTEVDKGGLFGTGVDFGRFFSLVTVGIGLPADTPAWFRIFFSFWQIMVLIFSVGFILSAIWDG